MNTKAIQKPLRHRLPGFLGKVLRRCVVHVVGAAIYVIGDLLDIAIGNGLKLERVWPRELYNVDWPWAQPSSFNHNSRPTGEGSLVANQNGLRSWGLREFLFFMDAQGGRENAGMPSDFVPKSSIIIPVFNNADHTFQCLKSLVREVDLEANEIIIVDNGSADTTAQLLARITGLVRVISNPTNQGFARACNQGAAIARGEYLVFLNNDTEVKPRWLESLTDTIETNPEIGAVGSMLVYPDGVLQEAGGIVWNDGTACNYGKGNNPQLPRFQFARQVDYCSGASLLVRQEVFAAVGGFDERYSPAFYEDVDLCFSIRLLRYSIVYQPKSVAIHYEGATAGTDVHVGFKVYQEINRRKFVEKWRSVLQSAHYANSSNNLAMASEKRRGPRIVVSDGMYSSPYHDAGSSRMAMILKMMAKRTRPLFVSVPCQHSPEGEGYLEKLGVEIAFVRDFRNHPADYLDILKQHNFDIAILSRPLTGSALLPLIRKSRPTTKIIYDTVDVHFRRLQQEYEVTRDENIAASAAEMLERESWLASQSDQVWCVTEEDKRALLKAAPDAKIEIIPTIHVLHPRGKPFIERRDLLFIGNFNHSPNKDAVHFFVKDIFPIVRDALPGVKFFVVGSNTPKEVMALQSQDIVVTGYLPDIGPMFASCRVFVAPLRFGAGIKGKIGDALSYGLPIVTTAVGAEGWGISNREHVLIADRSDDFANAVVELYRDRQLWQGLSDCGYECIRNHYVPDRVEQRIMAAFRLLGIPGLDEQLSKRFQEKSGSLRTSAGRNIQPASSVSIPLHHPRSSV